jgi:chorismate-pyruvate lyase
VQDDNSKDSPGENSLFRSEGFVKDWALPGVGDEFLPMSSLPPILRTLLITDGTIGRSLEAFFWESVNTVTMRQEMSTTDSDQPYLRVDAGEEVLVREVEIRGRTTDRVYATATSTIKPQTIPPYFRDQLLNEKVSIGVLIRESGLESYREILEIGHEPGANEQGDDKADTIYRTYCVYLGGEPAILITERFSMKLYGRFDDRRVWLRD